MNKIQNFFTCAVLMSGSFASSFAWADQQFGITVHNAQVSAAATSALPAGLSLRTDLQWKYIEKVPGQYSVGDYTQLDLLVKEAAAKGIEPIIVLCRAPASYDGGDLPKSAEAREAYVRYVQFVVNHFKGQVKQFEIWNEWNLNTGSKLNPHVWGEASDYVQLLKMTYPAVKAADPKAVVIGGVLGGTDGTWTEKFISSGGLNYLDAFSIHPYVQRHAQNHPDHRLFHGFEAPGTTPLPYTLVLGTPEESMAWLDQLEKRITASSPNRNIPIFVSEIGWPTSTSEFGVSENIQMAYLERFVLMASARPWIAGVWWYDLMDDAADQTNDEARFGLLHQDGVPKPSYGAFLKLKNFLEGSHNVAEATGDEGQILISGQLASGKEFTASWLPTDDFKTYKPINGKNLTATPNFVEK